MAGPIPSGSSSGSTPSHSEDKKIVYKYADQKRRKILVRRKKPRNISPLHALCGFLVDNQIGISVNLLLLLALAYICFPRARRRARKFFEMSGYDPSNNTYVQTWDDAYFVFFWIVVFTGVRAATMEFVLKPFAQWGGIQTKKGRTRFAEQGWMFVYYSGFWALGMYLYNNSSYWLNLKEMWTDFPTRTISPLMKWYYLVQTAFWLQQLFVVNIEERRKDHWQMFTHHIFTSALLFTSYGFYQTKAGNVILCIMDVVDILLPFAKMLNYLRLQTACDLAFATFMIVWLFSRHIAYLLVCYSIYIHIASPETGLMPYGCYNTSGGSNGVGVRISAERSTAVWSNVFQSFIRPGGIVCFNPEIQYGFLALLMALQGLTLLWFGMIVRVAYGVITGKGAQDSRSDDEVSDVEYEVEIDDECEIQGEEESGEESDVVDPALEEAPAVLRPMVKGREGSVEAPAVREARRTSPQPANTAGQRRKGRTLGTRASGISIPGHGDHKELLGRIGCDKPS